MGDPYGYESIYNSSCGYGYNGKQLSSPSKSIHSTGSGSASIQPTPPPHHYISSYRAKNSLSKRTGSKMAARTATSSSSSSCSSSLDRNGGMSDPCQRLQALLKQRYRHLYDNRPTISWCPDFHPPVGQMIFSLARDSSWEKGSATPQRPNLRPIPLPGIFSEDRVNILSN